MPDSAAVLAATLTTSACTPCIQMNGKSWKLFDRLPELTEQHLLAGLDIHDARSIATDCNVPDRAVNPCCRAFHAALKRQDVHSWVHRSRRC